MFFWGFYVVMPKQQSKPDGYAKDGAFSKQLEAYKKHHIEASDNRAWERSAWNAMGRHLPIVFILLGMALILVLLDTSTTSIAFAIILDAVVGLGILLYTDP
jgi:hypothetical protein